MLFPKYNKKATWPAGLIVAFIALLGFITFLVVTDYSSQKRIQNFAVDQLKQDTEKSAIALGYFFTERKYDLKNLARHRSILAFFENKALGMSMKYGLKSSLLNMQEVFERILEDRHINGHQIYKRIVFIDKDEGVIVDTLAEAGEEGSATNWDEYLSRSGPEPRIIIEQESGRFELIASIPYYFKENYQGQILAWIRPHTLYHLVEAAQALSRRSFFITCLDGRGIIPPPSTSKNEGFEPFLPDLSQLPIGRIHVFSHKESNSTKWLGFRVNVTDTPLCIMTVIPTTEVSTGMAQWYVPAGMGLIAVLILGGMVTAYRINTQRLILGTRLDESSKIQEKITEKNRQLSREIAVRRQAEEALRRVNLDLEERVKERTADLTLAVGQLEKEIEERKEAEGRLRASEERMRHLVESAPVGISINQGGRLVYANPAFVRMYGYEHAEEVLGRPVESTVAPEERELLWKRRAARLRGEGPPYSFEIKALRKSGEPFEAAVLGTPIDYEGDKAVLAFVIDMSVEKQLRSQLQQAQKMEALGTLAGGIAHDFNNILSAIIGYTELAKQGISPGGTVEDDLDRVLKSAERAKNLVKQILTFSRRTDEERKPLQPVLIVKEALKLLRASVPKNVRFEEVIDPLTGIIAADPTRIHQIMMNLCTNAVQAMLETDTEGVLGVRLGNEDLDEAKAWYMDLSPGSYVKLTVTDTGPGISEDDLARIFEPYFTTKAKGEGTGLGLSVVQGIVEAYGGRVLVESLPRKGTTFHVLFPRIEQVIDAAESVENDLQFSTGTEHILFVDDEPPLVDIGKRILERLGYRVTALTSGREALSCFAEAPADFDLVVTDLAMPDMAGDKLIRELVALRPDIPVILCSGFFEDANKERLSELGVSAFIGKPLTAQDLSQSIRRALDQ